MAKPGAGKRKMQATRKKQWNNTTKSLKSTGNAIKKGWKKGKKACYVATCVYGSYDCPEVWTLRRFRDETLEQTWYGRCFIAIYYTISPGLVSLFGDNEVIKHQWKKLLDAFVNKLNLKGISNKPYQD